MSAKQQAAQAMTAKWRCAISMVVAGAIEIMIVSCRTADGPAEGLMPHPRRSSGPPLAQRSPSATASGRVIDGCGRAIPFPTVLAVDNGLLDSGRHIPFASDKEGQFSGTVDHNLGDAVLLIAVARGYRPATVAINLAHGADTVIILDTGKTVSGRLLNNGVEVEGGRLRAECLDSGSEACRTFEVADAIGSLAEGYRLEMRRGRAELSEIDGSCADGGAFHLAGLHEGYYRLRVLYVGGIDTHPDVLAGALKDVRVPGEMMVIDVQTSTIQLKADPGSSRFEAVVSVIDEACPGLRWEHSLAMPTLLRVIPGATYCLGVYRNGKGTISMIDAPGPGGFREYLVGSK